MKLSIIIVNYNTYRLTKQTIDSVLEKDISFDYEIMLVDNASQDGSIEALQSDYATLSETGKVNIFKNTENLGFSKANNIGIKASKGDYILLLNSDTYIVEDCLQHTLAYIEKCNKEQVVIGALGCKVVLADGSLDHACKRGFPTPKASMHYFLGLHKRNPIRYGAYNAMHLHEDEVGEVDCLMGAFMLMPRRVLQTVGLLDEDFFMYGEDIDLCYRIKKAGYKIMYYPTGQIIHYKGGSSKKKRTKIIYDFHHAMWLFYRKHYLKEYNIIVSILVYTGIKLKYIIEIIKNSLKTVDN